MIGLSFKIKKCAIYPLVTEHNDAIVPEIETLDFVFLKCPPGVQSGSKIEWKSADGMTFETRIPFGVAPGEMFEGLNLKDTDNLSPSTPKDSYRTRQSKKNSSRCSIVGINGKIDPLSEYDEVDEEVIYSQESPNMVEFYRDFDWELDRFVEYSLPIKKPL